MSLFFSFVSKAFKEMKNENEKKKPNAVFATACFRLCVFFSAVRFAFLFLNSNFFFRFSLFQHTNLDQNR